MIFRTASKDKIGKNLSYPVGAELISQSAGDIPQAAQVEIHFHSQTTIWASQWKNILNKGEKYTIFSCNISWEQQAVDWGGNRVNIKGGIWKIDVYPVLREHRAIVQMQLLEFALPKFKEYLLLTTTSEGRRQRSYFSIAFDPITRKILVNGQMQN